MRYGALSVTFSEKEIEPFEIGGGFSRRVMIE
jgi:hypothetical protein